MAARAVVVTELMGDPQEVWKIVTKEKPHASPGHVVVHIVLRPVNPTDSLTPKYFLGHLKGKDVVIGSDGTGYVEEVLQISTPTESESLGVIDWSSSP
jgi:NADPH:quinone reductase-like Zn-dependent oxidoreductase